MSRHFLYKFMTLVILLIIVIGTLWSMTRGASLSDAKKTLNALGFSQPVITETKYQKGRAFHLDIKLDNNERLNVIQLLTNPVPLWSSIVGNQSKYTEIRGMDIVGRIEHNAPLDITNWSLNDLDIAALPPMIIKDSSLTLSSELAAVNLKFEADISPYKNGVRDAVFNITTKQYELKFDSVWTGTISDHSDWQYEISINEGGFNTAKAQASRAAGWITLEHSENDIFPVISGQLQMGMLSLHPLTMHNADLTFDGPLQDATIILKAEVAGFKGMTLALDSKLEQGIRKISAIIETPNFEDLLSFMTKIHDIDTWDSSEANIASLMLTEGNLRAIYNRLQNMNAERFTLEIVGTPLNLAGKITAYEIRDGVTQRQIISLDPIQRAEQ